MQNRITNLQRNNHNTNYKPKDTITPENNQQRTGLIILILS